MSGGMRKIKVLGKFERYSDACDFEKCPLDRCGYSPGVEYINPGVGPGVDP